MMNWKITRALGYGLLLASLSVLHGCTEDSTEDNTANYAWSGTMTARVAGVVTDFGDQVWLEEINGGDAWVIGNSGQTQLQFYLPSYATGMFSTDDGGMGAYVPDTGISNYDYHTRAGQLSTIPGIVSGWINVTTATASQFAGGFAFYMLSDPSSSDTLYISDGHFDLSYGPPATPDSPVGIWQYTEAGVEQETLEFLANGTVHEVYADYLDRSCDSENGSWTLDGDTLVVTLGAETDRLAWSLEGSTLSVWNAEVSPAVVFQAVGSMPSCEDYDFGSSTGWTGTLSATVDGTPMEFGSHVWLETIMGGDAWVIGDAGDHQLQFYIANASPGTYSANFAGDQGMGRYVPDTSVPGYDYSNPVGEYNTNFPGASGSIVITQASATQLTGSFSFVVTNATGDAITISNGVVNIQMPPEPTPAGLWQSSVLNDHEDTIEFAEGGSYTRVQADWIAGECGSTSGVWSSDATHIYTDTGANQVTLGSWSLTNGMLTIDFGGSSRTYHSVNTLPSCDDYNFDPLANVYGFWQRGGTGVWEETVGILEDHTFLVTVGELQEQTCFEVIGTWQQDGDSLRITYTQNFGPLAWRFSSGGSSLVLSAPGVGNASYQRVQDMRYCTDFGWESGPPVGIWQSANPGVFEYTVEYSQNGDYGLTYANFQETWCYEEAGSWTASADSLFLHFPESDQSLAYVRWGNNLFVTYQDGNWSLLTRVDDRPFCSDYGLGGSPAAPDDSTHPVSGMGFGPAFQKESAFRLAN
ncbi:MAG: hypothetical protein H6678_06195 [Candidatus Delongbacteria bacterium]|nr:hypothetical protein [Candidatus Delongbacteria bacterium]